MLLLTGIVEAQTDFRPGYIFTSGNDTLTGEIDSRNDITLGRNCKFRDNVKGSQIDFSPSMIVGFGFDGGRNFVSREVKGNRVFLEVLVKGKVTIYYFREKAGDRFFIEKESTGFSELPYYEETNVIDGAEYLIKSKSHITVLNNYMQDAPDMKSKINKIIKPEQKNLIQLGEAYNEKFQNQNEIAGYKKKLSSPKFEFEIIAGLTDFKKLNNSHFKTSFVTGLIGYIWLPITNERLFFRTGVLYSDLSYMGYNYYNYKIPVYIEYRYPKGTIRPVAGLGLNIYFPKTYLTVGFRGGVSIKLNRRVSLGIYYDVDFNSGKMIALFPVGLATQSVSTGLRFKF